MGKFRSKLKRHQKGKSWARGHSSTSNPENMKHRIKAKSRFFQPNLSLAPPTSDETEKQSGLTLEAILKHDAMQEYAKDHKEPTVDDVAFSLKSVNIDDEIMSGSNLETFKTYQTFASNYSACTNQSFNKLFRTFRTDSETHKAMLAILTAITDIIKGRNGEENCTEYFLLLMETIDNTKEILQLNASLTLLSMLIRNVRTPVLREMFSNTSESLLELLEQHLETDHQNIIRNILRCLCILLQAQTISTWSFSSALKFMDILLNLILHPKPKIRKSAHSAIVAIVNGSCFMKRTKTDEEQPTGDAVELEKSQTEEEQQRVATTHPADERIVKFCLRHFESLDTKTSKNVLHCLELLKDVVNTFKTEQIRTISENLLVIMTSANVLIRTKGFEVFYRLFLSKNTNLIGNLCGKLIVAIHDHRPDKDNVSETLRWMTVLREAYVHLATVDLKLCVDLLPQFLTICIRDLLPIDRHASSTVSTLNTIFDMCLKPACATEEFAILYRNQILKLIKLIHTGLTSYSLDTDYMKYITLVCAKLFEAVGKNFSHDVSNVLITLGQQYDTESPYRIPIEHAILSAVKYLGPESTLNAISITNGVGEVQLDKSWLLPLLREGIQESSVEFFRTHILKLASDCYDKWQELKRNKNLLWHSYELLCCQLWGLFPGCCRKVKDIENFKSIAKRLADALRNNPEFRAPILDGFKELIQNNCEKCNNELRRYAKNFLPCLFNIYVTKPEGTYEADIRKKTLEVIKEYLTVTPNEVYDELFETGTQQLLAANTENFVKDAIFDIVSLIIIVQDSKGMKKFFKNFIIPILQKKKSKLFVKDDQKIQKLQKKAYCVLEQILSSKSKECEKFVKHNLLSVQDLLLDTLQSRCVINQASRLKCLKLLIEHRTDCSVDDKLIIETIPEVVMNFKNFSDKNESIALDLLTLIGKKYQECQKLDEFVDIIISGMAGDQPVVTNSILVLRSILQTLHGSLTITTIQYLLDQILMQLVQKQRPQVEASVKFIITFVKVLPSPLVANHLEVILRSLSAMVPDTKRYCRLLLGYILKMLCKKFGVTECIKLVPGNDEATHKRLKKIRKDLSREKRMKAEDKADDDEDEEEFLEGLQAKSETIDDILEDSDSDLSEEEGPTTSQTGKELYIQEFPEDIVDLKDIKSVGNVMTKRPGDAKEFANGKTSMKRKNKDPNRGFKTAEDGRLIIPLDDKRKGNDSDGEEETEPIVDGEVNEDAMNGSGKKSKRKLEEDISDDDEAPKAPSRKRKALDAKSVASGKSKTSQYQPGGKGIHRPIAASVKSGYTNLTKKSAKSTATAKSYGSEYKSRKAQGDMKKAGKPNPYAYIPLSRSVLNKRKRAKHAGQFRSIVRGIRKGINKGTKSKASKAHNRK